MKPTQKKFACCLVSFVAARGIPLKGRAGEGNEKARGGLAAVVVETMAAGGGGEAGCDIRRLADVSIAFEARTSRGGDLLLVATKSAL